MMGLRRLTGGWWPGFGTRWCKGNRRAARNCHTWMAQASTVRPAVTQRKSTSAEESGPGRYRRGASSDRAPALARDVLAAARIRLASAGGGDEGGKHGNDHEEALHGDRIAGTGCGLNRIDPENSSWNRGCRRGRRSSAAWTGRALHPPGDARTGLGCRHLCPSICGQVNCRFWVDWWTRSFQTH